MLAKYDNLGATEAYSRIYLYGKILIPMEKS